MLNLEFLKLVAIAYIISCLVAYYLTKNWLQDFVYKTELSWWVFAISWAFVLIITIIKVSRQSYTNCIFKCAESAFKYLHRLMPIHYQRALYIKRILISNRYYIAAHRNPVDSLRYE